MDLRDFAWIWGSVTQRPSRSGGNQAACYARRAQRPLGHVTALGARPCGPALPRRTAPALARAAREQAGVEIGATYEIEIAAGEQARVVEVPADLAAALAADPAVYAAFQALAPSHRKEFVRWVTEAKKASTRADRVAKAVEMVREGRHR